MNNLHYILPEGWPRYFAHRGASTLAPENSLSAFKISRTLGCKGIELDIHLCRSGELVVIHDFYLDRLAGIHLKVEDLDFSDLQHFDTGSFFNSLFPDCANQAWSRERIPTLDAVFETIGPEIFLDIELKTNALHGEVLAQAASDCLARHDRKHCIVSSFNPFALRQFSRLSAVPIAAIYSSAPDMAWYLRHRECLYISGAQIKKPSREIAFGSRHFETGNKPVLVWTVDTKRDAELLLAGGVNSVITNRIQDFV